MNEALRPPCMLCTKCIQLVGPSLSLTCGVLREPWWCALGYTLQQLAGLHEQEEGQNFFVYLVTKSVGQELAHTMAKGEGGLAPLSNPWRVAATRRRSAMSRSVHGAGLGCSVSEVHEWHPLTELPVDGVRLEGASASWQTLPLDLPLGSVAWPPGMLPSLPLARLRGAFVTFVARYTGQAHVDWLESGSFADIGSGRRLSSPVTADLTFSALCEQLCLDEAKANVSPATPCSDAFLRLDKRELDGWCASLVYRSDRYSEKTVRQMGRHIQALFRAGCDTPDVSVALMPMLSPAERQLVLLDWNQTHEDLGPDVCLHELIEARVRLQPHTPALTFNGQSLSYQQVNARANQLARYLVAHGVRQDTLVAVCAERSFEMVIGLLAILKSGGAYLPLDPVHPQDRLAFMLEDGQAPVLLTQTHLLPKVASYRGGIFLLDADWPQIDGLAQTDLEVAVATSDLAYCIYTSGSTGRPKGVLNAHAGVVNRIRWMHRQYPIDERDVVLQKTPFGFDVSVWEFFWPLMAGARMVIAKPEGHKDPFYLRQLMADEGVTTLHFVPSMLLAFLDALAEPPRGARQVFCSGEALPKEAVQRFFHRMPRVELHNLYGPTEAAVDVTYFNCREVADLHCVPIGRPISNIQMYILDAQWQPVPVGVPGELYIGGVGLARGYLNRPELTERTFIANPLPMGGARLYRTGDLGRYLPDGNIEYLGRMDLQVKIRGFRIELGEIESSLLAIEGVREAAVLAVAAADGEKMLAAYLALEPAADLDAQALRARLLQRLPDYMVPVRWAFVSALPLSANGKIDRTALGELKSPDEGASLAVRDVAWQSVFEQTLAEAWASVLPQAQVHRHANFLMLGGSSLMAMKVAMFAGRAAGRQLSPLEVLLHPLLHEQARRLAVAPLAVAAQDMGDMARLGAVPLEITPGQKALLLGNQLDPTGSVYLVHTALQLPSQVSLGKLKAAFEHLHQRHALLRARVWLSDGDWQVVDMPELASNWWCVCEPKAAPPADLNWPSEWLNEVQRAMDLQRQGVSRVRIWPLPQGEHLLVWTVHHAFADEASLAQALADLSEHLQGKPWPALHGSITAISELARQWTDDDELEAQAQRLVSDLPELQPWLSRPPTPGDERIMVPQGDLSEVLESVAQCLGCTPFPVLLSALGLALGDVLGPSAGLIGTPFSRRSDPRVADLFTYWLDARLIDASLHAQETPRDTFERVKAAVLAAQAPKFQPIERLSEWMVSHGAHRQAAALTQFGFTWRQDPAGSLPWAEGAVRTMRVPQVTARYALCLHAAQINGQLCFSVEAGRAAFDSGIVASVWDAFQARLSAMLAWQLQDVAPARLQAPDQPASTKPDVAVLRRAWSTVLTVPLDQVLPSSHFIRSGGSSLMAMRMAANLMRDSHVTVPLPEFLADPTFAALCTWAQAQTPRWPEGLVVIGPQEAQQCFLLMPGYGGHPEGMVQLARAMLGRLNPRTAVAIVDLDSICARAPERNVLPWVLQQLGRLLSTLSQPVVGVAGFSLGGLLCLALSEQGCLAADVPVFLLDTFAASVGREALSRQFERLLFTVQDRVKRLVTGFRHDDDWAELLAIREQGAVLHQKADRATWRALEEELPSLAGCRTPAPVQLIRAAKTAHLMKILWRGTTSGFDPSHFGSWRQVDITAGHLDLPRGQSDQTAAIIAATLPYDPAGGLPVPQALPHATHSVNR